MGDKSSEWSALRASNRAQTVALAMRYLGADREEDAELLADFMMAHFDKLSAAASGKLQPSADFPDSARIVEELGGQMRVHLEDLFKTAQAALLDMFWRTLAMGTGRGPPR